MEEGAEDHALHQPVVIYRQRTIVNYNAFYTKKSDLL